MASEEGGDDGTGAIMGALGAAVIGGLGSYKSQKDTNEQNLTLGREQMQFQERMSNTSYQRAVEDMKKAGINPMLSTKMGGASTPPGSMPQIQNAAGQAISSAVQGAGIVREAQGIQQSRAQTDNINAQTNKVKSETMEKELNSAFLAAQLKKLGYDSEAVKAALLGIASESYEKEGRMKANLDEGGFEADVKKRKAEATRTQLDINRAKSESEFYGDTWGEGSPYIKSLMGIIKGLSSARGALR